MLNQLTAKELKKISDLSDGAIPLDIIVEAEKVIDTTRHKWQKQCWHMIVRVNGQSYNIHNIGREQLKKLFTIESMIKYCKQHLPKVKNIIINVD